MQEHKDWRANASCRASRSRQMYRLASSWLQFAWGQPPESPSRASIFASAIFGRPVRTWVPDGRSRACRWPNLRKVRGRHRREPVLLGGGDGADEDTLACGDVGCRSSSLTQLSAAASFKAHLKTGEIDAKTKLGIASQNRSHEQ